jgi:hypothetical protein
MRLFLILILTIFIDHFGKHDETYVFIPTTLRNNLNRYITTHDPDTSIPRGKVFPLILKFPIIKDTAAFIRQLKERGSFELLDLSNSQQSRERINYYKKIKLNGSTKKYILLEYAYDGGSNAGFPWKYQFLFTEEGKLVTILKALRFGFLKVFQNQNPYLLIVVSTAKGNGGHQLFRISGDSLENVYDGYTDYQTKTYDAHQDNAIYEPTELKIVVKDFNKDGYNDLAFHGKLVLIQGLTKDSMWYDNEIRNKDTISYSVDHPFKKLPVEYVFLFNSRTEHFVSSKKYSKKYPID